MEKKSLFLLLAIMTIFVGCGYQSKKTKEIAVDIVEICDSTESVSSCSMNPLDIQALINEFCKDAINLDTLCVVDGKNIYIGRNQCNTTCAIFSEKEFFVENPAFSQPWRNRREKNMDSCEVVYMDKTLKLNFRDSASVGLLSELCKIHPEVIRFQKDTLAVCADTIKFFLTVDLPNPSHEKAKDIEKWLMDLGYEEMLEDKIPVQAKDKDSWWKILAGRVIEGLCFDETNFSFPCILHHSIDFRARIFTDKFVTYQNCTSYFIGGMHGYNRERLNSFDFIHQKNIDWKYLFEEQYNEKVWELIYEAANENEKYKSQEHHYDLVKSDTREMDLGLSDDGIVFSYQSSEIGSYAEGAYHFVISYDKLKPYMTGEAKWCLE